MSVCVCQIVRIINNPVVCKTGAVSVKEMGERINDEAFLVALENKCYVGEE